MPGEMQIEGFDTSKSDRMTGLEGNGDTAPEDVRL